MLTLSTNALLCMYHYGLDEGRLFFSIKRYIYFINGVIWQQNKSTKHNHICEADMNAWKKKMSTGSGIKWNYSSILPSYMLYIISEKKRILLSVRHYLCHPWGHIYDGIWNGKEAISNFLIVKCRTVHILFIDFFFFFSFFTVWSLIFLLVGIHICIIILFVCLFCGKAVTLWWMSRCKSVLHFE